MYRPQYTFRARNIGMLFPDKVRVKLPVQNAEIIAVNSVGGGTPGGFWYQKGYGLNNLFAWDPAITAHQPRGFNQWSAMYDFCYVVSQKVFVKLNNTSATNDAAGIIGIYQSKLGTAEVTGASAYYDNLERLRDPDLRCQWKHFNTMGGGASQWTFLQKKFHTRHDEQDYNIGDYAFATDGSASPAFQKEWHVFVRCPQAASSKTFLLEVYATVDCIFYRPSNVTGS